MKLISLPGIILNVIFFLITSLFFAPSVLAQSGSLQDLSDIVNNMDLNAHSEHALSFILPYTANPIRTSDWIIISFPNFRDVTMPSSLGGSYSGGTPQFSVSGTTVRITNIIVAPGSLLSIQGISSTNPNSADGFRVVVVVAEDQAGNLVKNFGTTVSTRTTGNVSITASIDSPQSRIEISGYTGRQVYIYFTEGESVIGTHVSGLNGYFKRVFPGVYPGDHRITLYSIDNEHRNTTPITLNLYAPPYLQVSVTDQILSPTISLLKSNYLLGETITASGSAVPNSDITIFTESPLRTYATTASNEGYWTYTIADTSPYILGDYHIHALAQISGGATTLNSTSLGFSFISTATISGEACGDISRGDLNCNDLIDLTDFSILMYYWGMNNLTADINNNGLVDLTDFSIMMYWWGT